MEQTTVSSQAPRLKPKPVHLSPYLFLAFDCNAPTGGSLRISLEGLDELVIGRDPAPRVQKHEEDSTARMSLSPADTRMSSLHARLTLKGRDWFIVDEGSKNGTFVNGERVSQTILSHADIVQLGCTFFQYVELPRPGGSMPRVV